MMGDSSKVVIIEPGIVKTIDGKEYYNPERIIAGHPDDVAAYHAEQADQPIGYIDTPSGKAPIYPGESAIDAY